MPRVGAADVRVRDAGAGSVRASVDVTRASTDSGMTADAGADVVVGPNAVRSVDARASVHIDGVDARASVRMSDQGGQGTVGLRVHDAGRAFGVESTLGPDGLALRSELQLGPGRASVARDAVGRASAALDVGGALADGLDVRMHVGSTADAFSMRAGGTLRLSRWLPLPNVSLDVTDKAQARTVVVPDASVIGSVRSRMIDANPGARYERHTTVRTLTAGAERNLWAVFANLKLGFELGKEVEVTETRLLGAGPVSEWRADADAMANFRPGEGLSVSGQARVRLDSQGQALLTPVPARFGASAGLNGSVLRSGKVAVSVEKEEGSWARVTLRGEELRESMRGRWLDAAPQITLPTPALKNAVADIALDYAHAEVKEWMGALTPLRTSTEQSTQQSTVTVRQLRIDLSNPDVRNALDRALLGDWSTLERMVGHTGVELMERSHGEHETNRERHAHRAFGWMHSHERVHVESDREEERSGSHRRVTDRSWRRSESWQGWRSRGQRTTGFVETTTATSGGGVAQDHPESTAAAARSESPLGVKSAKQSSVQSSLEWSSEFILRGSVEKQLACLRGLAALLGDETVQTTVSALESSGHHASSTKAPTLRVDLWIDDDGLTHASAVPLHTLWDHASAAWLATHPGEEMPVWARREGRTSLEEFGPLRHGHADYAPYHEVREFIETLSDARHLPKHQAMKALHELLNARPQDPFWLAFLAKIAGAGHARMSLQTSSTGPRG